MRAVHAEDLMVLYMDGAGGLRTEFYVGGSGGRRRPIQRRGYEASWLSQPTVRQQLRAEFERRVGRLIADRQWRSLYWLILEFPERHLCASRAQTGWDTTAAGTAVDELMAGLKRVARSTSIGDHTAWDEVTAVGQRPELRSAAVAAIRRGLREGVDREMLRRCYPDLIETVGGGLGRSANEVYDGQWASAVVDYLRVLNNLRQGEAAENNIGYSTDGAPVFRLRAAVVRTAQRLWRSLPAPQRVFMADDDEWRRIVDGVWPEVRSRIDWGLTEAGSDWTTSSFRGGLYREPIHHLGLL
jgi:hypothetical protein